MGDFRILPSTREKVIRILSHPRIYYGKKVYGSDRGFSILIKTNPDFVSDSDLSRLSNGAEIKKIINGHEIE